MYCNECGEKLKNEICECGYRNVKTNEPDQKTPFEQHIWKLGYLYSALNARYWQYRDWWHEHRCPLIYKAMEVTEAKLKLVLAEAAGYEEQLYAVNQHINRPISEQAEIPVQRPGQSGRAGSFLQKYKKVDSNRV